MSSIDIPPITKNDYQGLQAAELTLAGFPAILEDPSLDWVVKQNIARYTEDLTWPYHIISQATKDTASVNAIVNGRFIHLSKIISSGFYGQLRTSFGAYGTTPFLVGKRYLVSLYVYADTDQWFWMRPMGTSGDFGHGPKFARGRMVSRHWALVAATTTSNVDNGNIPTTALGSGINGEPYWYFQGNTTGFNAYIGGFQIEAVPTTYRDGIAMIGDSTMQGSSGKLDLPRDFDILDNREVSTVLAAYLRAPIYNRAVGGERLDSMDARWATDMTPLAVNSQYCIIQGGINDIGQGRTLAQMQASTMSMANKALTDGMVARFIPVTPFAAAEASPALELIRQQYNAWLATTFPTAYIDILPAVQDPTAPNRLRTEVYGDGTHYTGLGKTNIAKMMASATSMWSGLIKPSVYGHVKT